MTTGTVTFYKMKGSLSSGEYPLLTTGQNLTSFKVHSATVKYAKGLQTRIVVPTFENWATANIAYLDNEFYWITASKESTTYNGSIEFVLDFMGPTSWFRSGNSVKGAWHKTATNECPYLKQEISNGLKLINSESTPTTLELGEVYRSASGKVDIGYWVQVSGFVLDGNNHRTGIGVVGFPIGIDQETLIPSLFGVSALDPSGNTLRSYPTFTEMIADITAVTGFQADQIIDCSISKRCPYDFVKTAYPNPNDSSVTLYKFQIKDASGSSILPSLRSGNMYYYPISTPLIRLKDNSKTLTITTNTSYIRQCASVQIRDWNENTLMEMPIDGDSMTITFRVHADISGIYTIVDYKNQQISIPEGKLPYIENAWETYKAYQMNGDRQAMENAINQARYSKETSDLSGIANTTISAVSTGIMTGAITSNVPGAVVGVASGVIGSAVSLWENQRAQELSEIQAKNDYELSKRRAIDQPQTSYNVAYGLIYCALNTINSLRVCIVQPYDVDSTYYANWVAEYGYPAEGVKTVTLANGYYQGKLLSDSNAKSGMYWDECNKTFMQGFKFISPS